MQSNDPSRRSVVGGLGIGVLAVGGANRASAQTGPQPMADLVNPVSEFPRPPFPEQKQSWPGLVRDISPRPDHGEKSYKGSGRLNGRRALITGGDSGIGRAAAIAFAREGADVAINYLEAEQPDADEVAELIRADGRKAVLLPGDIKDETFCARLVDSAANELGGLDILVNNAARQIAREKIEDIRSEDFDETFKTNIYATFWITKAAMKHLKPGSAIINTASVNAYQPNETMIDYAATKGAIMIFSKGLAKQLAPRGIRVNAVAPGPVWTPLQVTGGQIEGKLPEFGAHTPLGRAGQPVELAGIFVLLASNESSFCTGQVFGAVGGNGGP